MNVVSCDGESGGACGMPISSLLKLGLFSPKLWSELASLSPKAKVLLWLKVSGDSASKIWLEGARLGEPEHELFSASEELLPSD